jgi:hypothetical protein
VRLVPLQMRKEIDAGNLGTSAKEHVEVVMQRFILANASNNGSG